MPPIAETVATGALLVVGTAVDLISTTVSSSSSSTNTYPRRRSVSASTSTPMSAWGSSSNSNSNSASNRNNWASSGTSTSRQTHSSRTDRPATTVPRPTAKLYTDDRRAILRSIADETLNVLDSGLYAYNGVDYKLDNKIKDAQKNTRYFGPNSPVASWASTKPKKISQSPVHISVLQISTLDAARLLENVNRLNGRERSKTGVLNFASATQPGGGFKNGAEAQEESIARSSTLYPALAHTDEAAKFYNLHLEMKRQGQKEAYYSHAMIYSPKICVFRDDDGTWTYPFSVDVLSCAAVNAGEVRKASHTPVQAGLEVEIEKEMNERMGRILYLFEQQGMQNLVLGTFGTGVFRNNVAIVARLWAHLLVVQGARFKHSFERIIFAITGEGTFAEFQSAFDAWGQPPPPLRPLNGGNGGNARDLIQL